MMRLLLIGVCAFALCGAGVAAAHDTGKPHAHAAKSKKKKPVPKSATAAGGSGSPLQQQGVKSSGWGTGN